MLLLANAYYGLAPNKGIEDALAGQLASGWLAAFPFFLVYGMNVVAWEDLVKLISGIKKADTEPDEEARSKLTGRGQDRFLKGEEENCFEVKAEKARAAAPPRRSWRADTAPRPCLPRSAHLPAGRRRCRRIGRRRRRAAGATAGW